MSLKRRYARNQDQTDAWPITAASLQCQHQEYDTPTSYNRARVGPALHEIVRPRIANTNRHFSKALNSFMATTWPAREYRDFAKLFTPNQNNMKNIYWRGGELLTHHNYDLDRAMPNVSDLSIGKQLYTDGFGVLTRRLVTANSVLVLPPINLNMRVEAGQTQTPMVYCFMTDASQRRVPCIVPLMFLAQFNRRPVRPVTMGDLPWMAYFRTHTNYQAHDLPALARDIQTCATLPDSPGLALPDDYLMPPMPLTCMSVDRHPWVRTLLRGTWRYNKWEHRQYERVMCMRVGDVWLPVVEFLRTLRDYLTSRGKPANRLAAPEWRDYMQARQSRHDGTALACSPFINDVLRAVNLRVFTMGWKPECALAHVVGYHLNDPKMYKILGLDKRIGALTRHFKVVAGFDVPWLFDACPFTIIRGWWSDTFQKLPDPVSPWIPSMRLYRYNLATDRKDFEEAYRFHTHQIAEPYTLTGQPRPYGFPEPAPLSDADDGDDAEMDGIEDILEGLG